MSSPANPRINHNIVKEVFLQASRLPRPERAAFVREGALEPQIEREVLGLLREYEAEEFAGFPESAKSRFEPQKLLGYGGTGSVFQALDRKEQMLIALKVLRNFSRESLRRFKQEYDRAAELSHPNLTMLYELFGEGEKWFFTMQFVQGVDLLRYLGVSREPADDLAKLRAVFRQIALGVAALHRIGNLHRDLKPDNVLVTPASHAVIVDLGLASDWKLLPVKQSAPLLGTIPYASPEQTSHGSLTPATDWYSFGVMLFEVLTGKLPFEGTAEQLLEMKTTRPAPSVRSLNASIPEDLARLCDGLLQTQPEARPQSSAVLAAFGESMESLSPESEQSNIFVGRKDILAELAALLPVSITTQRPTVAIVRGRSGMGKSAVLKEFQRSHVQDQAGLLIFRGICHETTHVSFNAVDGVVDNLADYAQSGVPSGTGNILPEDLACLKKLFPVFGETFAADRAQEVLAARFTAQEIRERAIYAFAGLLRLLCAAAGSSMVWLIDDLHNGDLDSSVLLTHLLENGNSLPLLILATERVDVHHPGPCAGLIRKLATQEPARFTYQDIYLEELNAQEAVDLAGELLRGYSDPSLRQVLVKAVNGDPFLMTELAAYASSSGSREKDVSLDVGEVTNRRLEALPQTARTLLNVIAVAGQPIPVPVALHAGGLQPVDQLALRMLRKERLIRLSGTASSREVQMYHDRFTLAVLSSPLLPKEISSRLADALNNAGGDPALIASQLRLAGRQLEASGWFLKAARAATEDLAFDRSCDFYRQCLELGNHEPVDWVQINRELGEALAMANRAREAGQVLSGAAEKAAVLDRTIRTVESTRRVLELQQLAAGQFLRNGDIDEGMALVRQVARTIHMNLGAGNFRTLLSLAWRRPLIGALSRWFFSRGSRKLEEGLKPAQLDGNRLTILDTLWSMAIGLSMVDVIKAADFQARFVLGAIRSGDPRRMALAFALESCSGVIQDQRNLARTLQFRDLARSMAKKLDDLYVLGWCEFSEAAAGWLTGNWQPSYESSMRADAMLRNCKGAAWELVGSRIFVLSALSQMGEWRKFAELRADWLAEARARNDRFASTSLILLTYGHTQHLAADTPLAAYKETEEAMAAWSQSGFHNQDFWALYARVETALYEGKPMEAWQAMNIAWPKIVRSLLLKMKTIGIMGLHLRARAALALATVTYGSNRVETDQLLALVTRLAHSLDRQGFAWGKALADLVRAGVSSTVGKMDEALAFLDQAETGFILARMHQYTTAVSCRRSQLLGANAGGKATDSAQNWLQVQAIRNPDQLLLMLSPGRWSVEMS